MLFYAVFVLLQIFIRESSTLGFNSRIGFDRDLHRGKEGKYNPTSGASSRRNSLFRNGVQFRDMYFAQKLDHSRPTDGSTWFQRYFVNDLYYEEGGPIFLYVFGGEEADPTWMGRGPQWITYARKLGAMCISIEHRFYGKSRPKANTNITNLQYLTAEQALADIAYFIESANKNGNFPSDTKWVMFGRSYGGSLAAWSRMKYPHLVWGVVASGAPLLAKTDFSEYFQVVERSLRRHSPKCAENIAEVNSQLKYAIQHDWFVSKSFKLCSTLTNNTENIATLFKILAGRVAIAVQFNAEHYSIRDVCERMNDNKFSLLQRYANVNDMFLNRFGLSCTSVNYTEDVKYLRSETYQDSFQYSYRLWTYQTCTEFGFYQTSSKEGDLFGEYISVDYFIKMCKDIFGARFDKAFVDGAVERTNIEFGGLDYNASKVIFIHGDVDPWNPLGITHKTKSDAYNVTLIPEESHPSDMNSPTRNDSEHLKAARREIFQVLKSWLVEEDSYRNPPKNIKSQIKGEDQNVAA